MERDYSKKEILEIIEREAEERGIPRDDFLRFAYIETGGRFDEQANRGPNGAKGLFQFVPATAEQYGIRGRELDPVANTDAAARLYLDNRKIITSKQSSTGHPYLSGRDEPNGFDMYMAHQQGAGGYASIQAAIATGSFTRTGTRSNILNNVSSRDIESVTGVDMKEFRAMPDADMARTFVAYWDAKYARIRIPEMGIEPLTATQGVEQARAPGAAAPGEAAASPGIELVRAHEMGVQYAHVEYAINIPGHRLYRPGVDGKQLEQGYIDCSGWVSALQNETMAEINRKAGREVFSREDLYNPGLSGSGTILKRAYERSGVLLEGSALREPGALKEGMVIGVDTGPTRHDHWKGIDHVVMVVRNPETGELMASQSTGSKGVHMMPLGDYLAGARGTLYASDPLHKARELIQSRDQKLDGHTQGRSAEQVSATSTRPAQASASGLLRMESRGEPVRDVQAQLAGLGYVGSNGTPLERDGVFGPQTDHAVRQFQQMHGLKVDGIVGPQMIKALEHARQHPLVTEATHPNHALHRAIADALPRGTDPRVAANIALQAQETGIDDPSKIRTVYLNGSDVWVLGNGVDPGQRARVDLNAPTPDLQAMSDHMAQQHNEVQQQTQQQQQRMQQHAVMR